LFSFDLDVYGTDVADLVKQDHLCELGPGTPNRSAHDRLAKLDPDSMFTLSSTRDRDMAQGCIAGLWLLHNCLDQSHSISQEILTPTGSYWHALMHRREPDYPNSKYWFRRVEEHPIYGRLWESTSALASSAGTNATTQFLTEQMSWDPYRFVDACESVERGHAPGAQLIRQVAHLEWQMLFDYCHRRALSG